MDENVSASRQLSKLAVAAWRLAWRASPRWLLFATVLTAISASGVAGTVVATQSAFATVLEAAQTHAPLTEVLPAVLVVLLVAGLTRVANVSSALVSTLLSQRIQMATEIEILSAVTLVPLERFEEPAFHNRVWRGAMNAANTPVQAVTNIMNLLAGVLSVVALGSIVASFQLLLLPVMLCAAFIEMWFASRNNHATYNAAVDLVDAMQRRDILRKILISRETAAELRAFGLRQAVLERFHDAFERSNSTYAQVVRANSVRELLSAALSAVVASVGWALLLALYVKNQLALPETAAAALAFQQVRAWLGRIATSIVGLHGAGLFLAGFQELIDEGLRHRHVRASAATPIRPFDVLELDRVSFSYPGAERLAVQDVSLTLRHGEVLALVGENGSGKSTLAKLIAQLYQPHSGRILWNEMDTATLDRELLCEHIAVVFQDFTRYELSALENIGFGSSRHLHDLKRVSSAARLAGIADHLENLPEKYQTLLTPRLGGIDLSGGQWQRVALARAFFRDAPLIVLDEPTSALDARAERSLFDSIRRLATGRTVVLISHRFSTVRSADQIVVMHQGLVGEAGSHAELMAHGGRYAEMYELQASAFLDPREGSLEDVAPQASESLGRGGSRTSGRP